MKQRLLRRSKTGVARHVSGQRRRRIKLLLRRAGLRLVCKATGRVRSELKQFEREPHLAPF